MTSLFTPSTPDALHLVGMLHVPALPGAPQCTSSLAAITDHVLRDAEVLTRAGLDGLLLENFFDTPFYPDRVPPWTVAQLTALASRVRAATGLPLGINVLRNDALAALAVAHAADAQFIRVNILTGARQTDQGLIQGTAHELLRARTALHAEAIRILADVDVKHSAPLGSPRPLADEVADLLARGGADAVIVSGSRTGQPGDPAQLQTVKQAAGGAPVWVGSGVTAETIAALCPLADGVIVGTSLKPAGCPDRPVDPQQAAALVAAVRGH